MKENDLMPHQIPKTEEQKLCPHKSCRMENYSMMWHEADIYCNDCGAFVRYWDAG